VKGVELLALVLSLKYLSNLFYNIA